MMAAKQNNNSEEALPMLTFLRDLVAHAEWANAVFFHVWATSPARDHEELRRRVGHVVGVHQGFLSILRGEAPGRPPDGPPPPFDDLKTRAVTGHAGPQPAWKLLFTSIKLLPFLVPTPNRKEFPCRPASSTSRSTPSSLNAPSSSTAACSAGKSPSGPVPSITGSSKPGRTASPA